MTIGRSSWGVIVFTSCVAGCSLVTSLDGLSTGEIPDGGGTTEGGSSGSSSSPADADSDSGTPTQGPCAATKGPEICDDGIDNDCNGLTDCTDPACNAGYECNPTIPSGWTPVAYTFSETSPCPSGYPTVVDAKRPPFSNSCSCSCAATSGSCGTGDLGFAWGTSNACGTGSTPLPSGGGSCAVIPGGPIAMPANPYSKVTPPPPPAACSGTPGTTLPAMSDVRYCKGPTRSGLGCSNNGACVPKTSDPYAGCIMKDGAQTCPSRYSDARRVGTSPVDNRSCGNGCTCSPSSCGGKIELFASATCAGGKDLERDADNKCDNKVVSAFSASAYKYLPGSGCSVTTPTPVIGSITFAEEKTICCPQSGGE